MAPAANVCLVADPSTGQVQRAIALCTPLDRALGLDRYRLVSDLADRDGYRIERRVMRRVWYAPWRRIQCWEPLLLVDLDQWSELRFQTLSEARAWLRFNIARGFTPHPTL